MANPRPREGRSTWCNRRKSRPGPCNLYVGVGTYYTVTSTRPASDDVIAYGRGKEARTNEYVNYRLLSPVAPVRTVSSSGLCCASQLEILNIVHVAVEASQSSRCAPPPKKLPPDRIPRRHPNWGLLPVLGGMDPYSRPADSLRTTPTFPVAEKVSHAITLPPPSVRTPARSCSVATPRNPDGELPNRNAFRNSAKPLASISISNIQHYSLEGPHGTERKSSNEEDPQK